MNFIYLLLSKKDKKTYIGSTTDLKRRLKEHRAGQVKATRDRRPLELVYKENYSTIDQARKREHYLKTAAGRRWLKKNIFNNQQWGIAKR